MQNSKIKTKIKAETYRQISARVSKKFWIIAYSIIGILFLSLSALFISFNFPNQFEPFAYQIFKPKPVLIGGNIVYPTDTFTPTFTPTSTPTPTPIPPTPTPLPPTETPYLPLPSPLPVASGKIIDVNLSSQSLVAYENGKVVLSTLISSGLPGTPTPVGTFYVQSKYVSHTMSGPGYYLPGVPYSMYFMGPYALHGTYWHNNFGQPMSHGCVNLPTWAAEILYYWDNFDSKIVIHY
jgi:hypothetical protein